MSKTWTLKIGDRIRHPDWGAGKVLGLVRGGRVVKVEFDEMTGVPWEIPIDGSTPLEVIYGSGSN